MAAGRRIAVLGLGNVLMGDDALGPYLVRLLESRFTFPDGVTLEDLGTPGLDLQPYLAEADVVILVDTVRASGEPGELRCYRREEVLRYAPAQRIGPHDPGVKQALLALEFAGGGPREVFLAGVIPARVEHGVGLSPEVRRAIPAVLEAVVGELVRLDAPPVPRSRPGPADIWWERPAGRES